MPAKPSALAGLIWVLKEMSLFCCNRFPEIQKSKQGFP
jgi:hypothetical protein